MIRLLVDGVFFQITNTGIARVWRSVLQYLAKDDKFEIYFLDRGRAPRIQGINYIPFPQYHDTKDSAADSFLIQKICDYYKIDAFTSSYYTTPVSTPMLLMVYDMIPELFGFDLTARPWMEKSAAIGFAQRFLSISHNTKNDLMAFYPEIPSESVAVAHCGVDGAVFYPHDDQGIETFREKFGLNKPYFLFVGSRVQHNGYKNSRLFFDAIKSLDKGEFDVFCVGGEKVIEDEILQSLPAGVKCFRVELTDDELATAYGGAMALVYPSLYEGFGMPVIEAMASGCPVITTHHGSLAEAAGNAACLISGTSIDEMREAIEKIQDLEYSRVLREKGLDHVKKFSWEKMALSLRGELEKLVKEHRSGVYDDFLSEWRRLREIQASVDYIV